MAEPPEDSLMDEREERMVSPTGGGATFRVAHFLKPCVSFVDGPVSKLPPHSLSSATARYESTKQPPEVLFRGWTDPSKKWKKWVDRMHSLYQSVWKKAGIHDAVMSSTYQIRRNDDLVFGISERWCSETKTFVFPWGEATITLEDMIILGGYSVLGESVSKRLVTRELEENEARLLDARLEVVRSKSKKALHFSWMAKFLDSGSEIEHEAFLALWLSRFVFPAKPFNTMGKNVFHIAVRLAGGTKLALAPAVLASLYRDLSLLKSTIVASNILEESQCKDFHRSCTLWAPLHLVQVWAWERFPVLRPQPTSFEYGKPRLARWGEVKVKKVNIAGVRQAINSAGDYFEWRPYSNGVNNWLVYKIYREKEEWVLVQPGLAEEVESLARCLRVSELVGLECIEQYLPHRVARQFGMDQDIPGQVSLSNATPEAAWSNYSRPISDKKLYIPSRHFKAAVTSQYWEWWNKTLFPQQDVIQGVVKKMSVPKCSESTPKRCKIEHNDPDVPPGFPPKGIRRVETMDSSDDDGQTLKEMIRNWISNGNSLVGTHWQSSSSAADRGAVQKMEAPLKPVKGIVKSEPDTDGSGVVAGVAIGNGVELVLMEDAVQHKAKMVAEDATESGARTPLLNTVSVNCNLEGTSVCEKAGCQNVGECSNAIPEILPVLELEARISKLEKLAAQLKAAKDNSKRKYIAAEVSKAGKGKISAQIFAYSELRCATQNFKLENLLGEGGFGRVYKGHIQSKNLDVAVKQLDRNGFQGNREFLVEVLILSLLHHPNLVNLVGYCCDGDQRILVYEYMPNGSLENHLFDLGQNKKPLDWKTRMKIAEGAARGLEYLHEKASPPVIYRDFKASNILLDDEFNPKLSDFGLAKLGPTRGETHVSTRVMGTYGYCAPEYASTGKLTTKSDVYSFGVVLLELITGRRVIDCSRPTGEQNLIDWAQPLFRDKKKLPLMADPLLEGKYPIKGLYQALAVAAMCLREEASIRPLISDVLIALEYISIGNGYRDGTEDNTSNESSPDRTTSEDPP